MATLTTAQINQVKQAAQVDGDNWTVALCDIASRGVVGVDVTLSVTETQLLNAMFADMSIFDATAIAGKLVAYRLVKMEGGK